MTSTAADTVRLFSPISIRAGADDHLAPVLTTRPGAQIAADPDLGDVLNPYRHPATGRDDHPADVRHGLQAAGCTHDVALPVIFQVARTLVGVVDIKCPRNVTE